MRSRVLAGLFFAACVSAQTLDPMIWARGVAEQFSKYSEPVTSTYALARLGTLVCPFDRGYGGVLFSQALGRLDTVKTEVFFEPSRPRLPVASFAGLWKSVSAAAIQCDQGLMGISQGESFKQRSVNERAAAGSNVVRSALNRIQEDPDRAAQLATLVLEAGDPDFLDFDGMGLFLAQLRDRAPELGDEVFLRAMENVLSQPAHSTANFSVLGKYLFVNQQQRADPDIQNLFLTVPSGNAILYQFDATRNSANTDLVEAYIQGLLRLIEASLNPTVNDPRQNAQFDALVAINLAQFMIPHAEALELSEAQKLRTAIPRLAAATRGQSLQLKPETYGNRDRPETAYTRARAQVDLIRKKEYAQARSMLNTPPFAQLIDFAEALDYFKSGDLVTARRLANQLQPGGVKRALLYFGLVAKGDTSIVGLATREAQAMPAEFRAAFLSSLANSQLTLDPKQVPFAVRQIVQALNAARTSPRRWRFDPRRVRGAGGAAGATGEGSSLDIPSILRTKNSFTYIIDTGIGRISYPLDVPNTGPFSLVDFLRNAKGADLAVLESIVLDLRDEAQRADAVLALGELRFGPAPPAPGSDLTRAQ